jgi:hypothetical protein
MSKETLIVGCKLPNGLHLDLVNNSGERIRHTIAGANASRIVGGYGMTPVPSEFMEKWLKKNANLACVRNRDVFVQSDPASAISVAKEQREIITGLEAIDPVTQGMLNNENGDLDKKAVNNFRAEQAKNPMRNRQEVE